jgi:subtilase family serine protease
MIQSLVRFWARRVAPLAVATIGLGSVAVGAPAVQGVPMHPLISDFEYMTNTELPPTNAQCHSRGRRCFSATAFQNAYDLTPLYAAGFNGKGRTIAIIDSFGSATIANDLRVFNNAMGLQHMCGETDVNGIAAVCTSDMPKFSVISFQGSPPAVEPPPSSGTGQEAHNLWALEVSLDVEWSHAIAPGANILLVTTPTAETLGVQGFPDMMKAEQQIVDNHMADVISQSFGAGEETFSSVQSLLNQRHAFESARTAGITVFASSGDGGTFNTFKEPVKNPNPIPGQSVIWPGSDPLVTSVGGTSVCLDEATGTVVDNSVPPAWCKAAVGARETTWQRWVTYPFGVVKGGLSGGGFSKVFAKPNFQNTLPAGSTTIGDMRGLPDIAWQADSRTGVLVYMTEPPLSGLICPPLSAVPPIPCSTGWYVVGGTSSSSPQWAGMIAVAAQMNGGPLGYLNPALYKIASDPAKYAADFHDITIGNNLDPFAANLDASGNPIRLGFEASTGWDPVTGLGTPDANNLIPDLIFAVNNP